MFKGILHLHITSVVLFLILYFIKNLLLLLSKYDRLDAFNRRVKVPEMIISTLFLLTGVYLWTTSGNIGTWLYVKVIAVVASIPLAIIGFKKRNKVLTVVSFILLLYAYRVAETKSPSMKRPSQSILEKDTAAEKAVSGEQVYSANCANCHGPDGTLGYSGAADLSKSVLDSASSVDIIKNGKGAMQPFSGVLSEKEISSVSSYIQNLRK